MASTGHFKRCADSRKHFKRFTMSFIYHETLELSSKRKVQVTSSISQAFINSEKGDRIIIPLPYRGDQDASGFVKNLKKKLQQSNQDYIIYETEDCHAKSNKREDYIGYAGIPALKTSDQDEDDEKSKMERHKKSAKVK